MNSSTTPNLVDLVVNGCPQGCDKCSGLYINELTGHRIVCRCGNCDHLQSAKSAEVEAKVI